MKFIVYYTGGTGRLSHWRKEYTELDSIEIFFKKYFEEMLADKLQVYSIDGAPFIYEIKE